MMRNVFRSKIHRATVTQADLDYEGSVNVDERNRISARGAVEVPGPARRAR